jgi:hypothetical protein
MTLLAWRTCLKERWGGSSRHVFTGRHVRELSYLVLVDDESPPCHTSYQNSPGCSRKKYWCRLRTFFNDTYTFLCLSKCCNFRINWLFTGKCSEISLTETSQFTATILLNGTSYLNTNYRVMTCILRLLYLQHLLI